MIAKVIQPRSLALFLTAAGHVSKVRFALDSPLEGDGFEPSVPVARELVYVAEGELGIDGAAKKFGGGPVVRIHLPPPESLQTPGPARSWR